MESKIEFDEKIRVFISSICGVEKYDKIRKELKKIIEKTGMAKVYLFEGVEHASSLTAEQEYLYKLDDSDVCIFLIDNKDGVRLGVLNEHQRAKTHAKKSIYIFCNEKQIKPTQIQKELTGGNNQKYYITDSFEEFVRIGRESLINDIGKIYVSYCKGRLIDPEFTDGRGRIKEIDDFYLESLDKNMFKNIDKTKNIISKQIYNRSNEEIENTCEFDLFSSEFLKIILGKKTIKEFNIQLLLNELKEMQSDNLYKVVAERWNAIQYYYMDNLKKSIEYENKALDLARKFEMPNWIIQDILVDLRNLYILEGPTRNKYILNSSAQEELNKEDSALFYPLLDRYESSFYGRIINQYEKASIRSPYAVTFGNTIDQYSDYISNIHIMAIFNGSLTQLGEITNHMKNLAFYLCNQYSDWEFRVLLLKMTIFKRRNKDVKATIDLFNDVYGKMNFKDAKEIYEFAKVNPIKYQRNITQLLAFQYLGYYFDDEYYKKVWDEIYEMISSWIVSEDSNMFLGDYVFDAINENLLRLDNDLIIENILMKIFSKGLEKHYDKSLMVISKMDFEMLSKENIIKIYNQLIALVEDEKLRGESYNLERVIISTVEKAPKLYNELDNAINKNMPEFYDGIYSLEIKKTSQLESNTYIKDYVEIIRERNKNQGKNGKYKGFMDNPYKTIENIITLNEMKLEYEIIKLIISTCKETLFSENQTLSAKVKAIKLINYICLELEDEEFDFEKSINEIIDQEEIIFKGKEDLFIEKTSKTTLHFNIVMMKLVFNRVGVDEILELISIYTKNERLEKLEALKTIVSISDNRKTDKIDDKILLLILQFSLGATNDENHDIRYFATKSLLYYISEENKEPIMKKLLKLMDFDSVYIKSQILDFEEKLKELDKGSFEFIKEKALVDNHFVIRERAQLL